MAGMVYLGIKGGVIAVDRESGAEIWATALGGSDFVSVLVDGDRIFAGTKGEAYCLDAVSGSRIWHNDLPGRGLGIMTIATAGGSTSVSASAGKRRKDAEDDVSTS